MISCLLQSQCTAGDRDDVWQRVMSHAACSCHAASVMLQTSESWNLSENLTFGKSMSPQRACSKTTKTTEKGGVVIWHCCESTPKSSVPQNKSTRGCPVCENKTASTTAGQMAVAFPVWVTPYPKSDVANMLPGKTGNSYREPLRSTHI